MKLLGTRLAKKSAKLVKGIQEKEAHAAPSYSEIYKQLGRLKNQLAKFSLHEDVLDKLRARQRTLKEKVKKVTPENARVICNTIIKTLKDIQRLQQQLVELQYSYTKLTAELAKHRSRVKGYLELSQHIINNEENILKEARKAAAKLEKDLGRKSSPVKLTKDLAELKVSEIRVTNTVHQIEKVMSDLKNKKYTKPIEDDMTEARRIVTEVLREISTIIDEKDKHPLLAVQKCKQAELNIRMLIRKLKQKTRQTEKNSKILIRDIGAINKRANRVSPAMNYYSRQYATLQENIVELILKIKEHLTIEKLEIFQELMKPTVDRKERSQLSERAKLLGELEESVEESYKEWAA